MAGRTAIQERVAEAILDVAADLLARGGEPPSMADIAEAAGVSRATLYRYFPTRERLLQALTATGLERLPPGWPRPTWIPFPSPRQSPGSRAWSPPAAASTPPSSAAFGLAGAVEQQIGTMIQALLQRGIDDGTFRSDLTVDELGFVLGQLLQAAGRMAAERQAGVEKAAALVTSVFLHGTQNRPGATAGDRAIRPPADAEPQEHANQEDGEGGLLPVDLKMSHDAERGDQIDVTTADDLVRDGDVVARRRVPDRLYSASV